MISDCVRRMHRLRLLNRTHSIHSDQKVAFESLNESKLQIYLIAIKTSPLAWEGKVFDKICQMCLKFRSFSILFLVK